MGRHSLALRTCRRCGLEAHTEQELDLFAVSKHEKHGRRTICRVCHAESRREAYDRRGAQPEHQIRKMYGCTLAEYEERMASSSQCEICGTTENLVYDHDHDTMKFRGVLCRSHNAAIGQLGDTAEAVQRALNYLTTH